MKCKFFFGSGGGVTNEVDRYNLPPLGVFIDAPGGLWQVVTVIEDLRGTTARVHCIRVIGGEEQANLFETVSEGQEGDEVF